MSLIFINYRRRGEAYAAALLDDRLSEVFGSRQIFRASRSIRAGADFELSILRAIEHCRVMLVLIGPNWPDAFAGEFPIDRDDWVRREIVEAFKQEVPVIPILLSGSTRLSEDDIPADIGRLVRSQYLRFDYRNLEQDSKRIILELRCLLPELRSNILERMVARFGLRRLVDRDGGRG